jgi:hypothetical protein
VIAGAVAATVDHVRVHWRNQPDEPAAADADAGNAEDGASAQDATDAR